MSDDTNKVLTAPELDLWLQWSHSFDVRPTGDEMVAASLRRAFATAEALEDCGGDEARIFWAELGCGTFDDFASLYDDDSEVDEYEWEWTAKYSGGTRWFQIALTRYHNQIGLSINGRAVTVTASDDDHTVEQWPDPRLRQIVAWMERASCDVVEQVRAGTYNEHVAANLPYRKRLGKIRRAEWWEICPDGREWHLGDFSADEADRLYQLIARRSSDFWHERLPVMTVDDFLAACQIGYRATQAEGCDSLTARELYQRHADGRHDGLLDIEPSSPQAFADWVGEKSRGGHPWEVLRGGNSTHVSLYPSHDDDGWWFTVAGKSAGRSVETARFFLALVKAGLPAQLADASELATMLIGADDIGIVPEDVFPRYCQGLYPGENLIDFMNLNSELEKTTIEQAYWYPVPLVRLAV